MATDSFLSLSLFPPEVLSSVLIVLEAQTICKLFLSGDKILIRSMTERGAVKEFHLTLDPPYHQTMPPLVYNLAGLEVLDLKRSGSSSATPIGGIVVEKLPKTLRAIRFDFPESLPLFLDIPADETKEVMFKDLGSHFTHVREISYSAVEVEQIPKTWLSHLPPTLTTLYLLRRFKASNIHLLPRQLVKLQIELLESDVNWIEDPKFPPFLEGLEISDCSSYGIYRHLPRTLNSLSINFNGDMTEPHLPEHFQHLPPNLKLLDMFAHRIDPALLNLVPKSLTSVHITIATFTSSDPEFLSILNSLPRHLKNLHFWSMDALIQPESKASIQEISNALKGLANHLVTCDRSFSHAFADIDWFPPLLSRLTLKKLSKEMCKILPPTLESLSVHSLVSPDEPAFVPNSTCGSNVVRDLANMLKRLELEAGIGSCPSPKITPEMADISDNVLDLPGAKEKSLLSDAWKFPSNLTTLTVSESLALPSLYGICQLKSLTRVSAPHLIFFQRFLSQNIGDLRLEVKDAHEKYLDISHFPKLQSVQLFTTLSTEKLTSFLSTFPKSVEMIFINASGVHISADVLLVVNTDNLPKLQHLNLRSPGVEGLEDRHLVNLPSGLSHLGLEGTFGRHYTPNCITKLPRTISSLLIPAPNGKFLDFEIAHLPHIRHFTAILETNGEYVQFPIPACDRRLQAIAAERKAKYRGFF
jgi:hypothetical protein